MADNGGDPVALRNRPTLKEWMREFVDGFTVLHSTRQTGMGANPITMSEMLAYLEIFGSDDPHTFIKYILAMDDAFLKASAQKAEREKEIEKRKAANG